MNRRGLAIALGIVWVTAAAGAWGLTRSAPARASPPISDPGPANCLLSGTVRRAGQPVAAAVFLHRAGPANRMPTRAEADAPDFDVLPPALAPVLARATAAADGRYAIPALSTGIYLVRAIAADGAVGSTVVPLWLPGESGDGSVEVLLPSAVLRGRVAYVDGSPFHGVVHVTRELDSRRYEDWDDEPAVPVAAHAEVRDVPTDERGAFEASGLTPGEWRATVVAGSVRAWTLATVPSDAAARIDLPLKDDGIDVTVVAEATGAPVSGAAVSLHTGWPRRGLAFLASTGADGRVRLPPVLGSFALTVRAAGFATHAHEFGRPLPARIALDHSVVVRGRAVSASDGRPVAGLVVEASSSGSWPFTEPDARTTTDADGRYELAGLAPGEVRLRVHDAKGVARGMSDLELEDALPEDASEGLPYDPLCARVLPGGEATLDLVLEPAARIAGRLTDAAGRPAAGVLVRAARPPRPTLGGGGLPSHYAGVNYGVTDADGRFSIDGLVPTWTYALSARRESFRATEGTVAPLGGAERVVDLAFPAVPSFAPRAAPPTSAGADRPLVTTAANAAASRRNEAAGSSLPVRVVDPDGRPVPRADARWEREMGAGFELGAGPVVDGLVRVPRSGDGGAVLWIHVLRARRADGVPLPLGDATVGPFPGGTSDAQVRLPPEREVVGRVVDATGVPIVGLRLRAARAPRAAPPRNLPSSEGPDARTDADGRFRIRGLGDEVVRVACDLPDRFVHVAPIETRTGGPPLEIRALFAGEARVTVVGPDGKGIEHLYVSAAPMGPPARGRDPSLPEDQRHPSAFTDRRGVALLTGLDPGRRYRLSCSNLDQRGHWMEILDWSPKDVELRLRGPSTLRGVVRDPAGRPVAGAFVYGFVDPRRREASAVTGPDGGFVLEDVGIGVEALSLVASMIEWGRGTEGAAARAPRGGGTVDLLVDPGLEIVVRLEGRSIAKRQVFLTSDVNLGWAADQSGCVTTDDAGVARFRGLSPGRSFAVWVRPGYHQQGHPFDATTAYADGIEAAAPAREVRLAPAPGGTLYARAREGSHRQVTLEARHGGLAVEGEVLADGTFAFDGLLDLEWTVVVDDLDADLRAEAKGRPGQTLRLDFLAKPPR